MIDEHQARPGTANLSELGAIPEMEDNEEKAVKLVMHLFDKSKRHRSKYDRQWLNFYRFFRGDQWIKARPSYRHSEVLNFVFMAIQSMVPIMTDGRPMPNFAPHEPGDKEFADLLTDLFEADYQKNNWLYKETEVVYDGHIYGTGFSKLDWDEAANYGAGNIRYESFEPLDYYPDPDANEINGCEEKSNYVVTAVPTDTEKLRLKWKGHKYAGAIKADLEDPSIKVKTSFDKDAHKRVQQTDKDLSVESFGAGDVDGRKDKTLVITAYMKPADVMEEEESSTDEEGNESVQFITKKRYPKGRKLVIINGRPFEDGPLENDDKKFPFSKYVNYILPREHYGISEVEQLQSPQMIFNKLISFTLDVMTFAGNPVWLIPTGSGVDPGSFHNAPGMQIPYSGEQAPRTADGAQLQPFVMQLIDRMENWFNSISGSTDVSRGVKPGGVTAASAIENLQDAAQTRIRQKMRNFDSYLVETGEQWVQLALQHYDAPRVFRLTNKEGVDKYFKFHVESSVGETGEIELDEKGDPIKVGITTDFKTDDLGRQVPDTENTKRHVIRGHFDVKINTGSGLPFKKAEKERRLLDLFSAGIIDDRTVLEELEFPKHEEILERMAEQREAAAAQQGAG